MIRADRAVRAVRAQATFRQFFHERIGYTCRATSCLHVVMISEQPYSINAILGGTNDLGTSESFIVGNAAAVAFSISHPISDIGTACIGLLPRNV